MNGFSYCVVAGLITLGLLDDYASRSSRILFKLTGETTEVSAWKHESGRNADSLISTKATISFKKSDGSFFYYSNRELKFQRARERPEQRDFVASREQWEHLASQKVELFWPDLELHRSLFKLTGEIGTDKVWASDSNVALVQMYTLKADGRKVYFTTIFDRGTGALLSLSKS